MICRVLDATEGAFFPTVRVLVTRYEEIARLCRKRNISVVLHSLPNRNDTVRLGLQGMEEMDRCLFAPADQPLLTQGDGSGVGTGVQKLTILLASEL